MTSRRHDRPEKHEHAETSDEHQAATSGDRPWTPASRCAPRSRRSCWSSTSRCRDVLLAQVLERPADEVAAALRDLAADYDAAGRGFELRQVAGGWRFYTRERCAPLRRAVRRSTASRPG